MGNSFMLYLYGYCIVAGFISAYKYDEYLDTPSKGMLGVYLSAVWIIWYPIKYTFILINKFLRRH